MKLFYTLTTFCTFILFGAKAGVFTVQVTNNQFTPAHIPNATVGDVIRFEFVSGFHNATSVGVASAIPLGASALNSGTPSGTNPRTYNYTITVQGTYKYICEVHADPASFTGMVGTFTAGAALPATLKEFRLFTTTNKKPSFSWTTLTELNVSHFSLKKSTDGITYAEVAKVGAAGNSTIEQSYSSYVFKCTCTCSFWCVDGLLCRAS